MSQQTLRRTIHPVVCVLDEKNFIAEFTASDETIDLTNEVIRAAGWRFNLAKKNFPFVNSHDYSDIRNMIGRVVDFGVVAGKLMNTVQYACDVAENQLAKFAWKMTVAKYLPAVSVGCVPLLMATRWDSDKKLYNAQRAELKLARDVMPDVIYIEQEQIELSQCIIGANPNAIAQIEKAYQAGILNDSDITHFSKMSRDFARAFEQHNHRPRAYSFPDSKPAAAVTRMLEALGGEESTNQPAIKTHMQKHDFLKNFSRLTGDTKATFENLEFTRRGGNETENQTALRITAASLRREQCLAGDPVDRYFAAHPLEKAFWNVAARKFAGAGLKVGSAEEEIWREYTKAVKSFQQGISPVDHFGGGMFPIPVSPDIFDLLFIYGAFKDLGVTEMPGQFSKFVVVNGRPTVLVYPADQQGNITAPADTTTSGFNLGGPEVAQVCNTFIGLIDVSRELLNDQRVDLAALLFRLFFQAIAGAIDYCSFQGNGAGDFTNAYQTGIFMDANIKSYQATLAGESKINMLQRTDFINTIGVVNPAALQQPCRWYISPKFIPSLLTLKDGDGASWLLKTPADTGGEWHLVGFPVTWAAAAPANELAGKKVAAFGEPNSYCVGIRQLFELMSTDGSQFHRNVNQIRAIARGKCLTRDSTGFATLKLSAQ